MQEHYAAAVGLAEVTIELDKALADIMMYYWQHREEAVALAQQDEGCSLTLITYGVLTDASNDSSGCLAGEPSGLAK